MKKQSIQSLDPRVFAHFLQKILPDLCVSRSLNLFLLRFPIWLFCWLMFGIGGLLPAQEPEILTGRDPAADSVEEFRRTVGESGNLPIQNQIFDAEDADRAGIGAAAVGGMDAARGSESANGFDAAVAEDTAGKSGRGTQTGNFKDGSDFEEAAEPISGKMPWVLIPMDPSGNPSGNEYYVPLSFFSQLQKQQAVRREGGDRFFFLHAIYSASLHQTLTSSELMMNSVLAKYEVEVLFPDTKIRFPFFPDQVYVAPGSVRLNGEPLQILWENEQPVVRIDRPGRYLLEFTLLPIMGAVEKLAPIGKTGTKDGEFSSGMGERLEENVFAAEILSASGAEGELQELRQLSASVENQASQAGFSLNGLRFSIPRIPNSQFELHVSHDVNPLFFPFARGQQRFDQLTRSWVVQLGSSPMLAVYWRAMESREAGRAVAADELYAWRLGEKGHFLESRCRFRAEEEIRHLEWTMDSRWYLSEDELSVFYWKERDPVYFSAEMNDTVPEQFLMPYTGEKNVQILQEGKRKRVVLSFPEGISESLLVCFALRTSEECGNVGMFLLPEIRTEKTRVLRRWYLAQVPSSIGISVPDGQNSPKISIPEFLSVWREFEPMDVDERSGWGSSGSSETIGGTAELTFAHGEIDGEFRSSPDVSERSADPVSGLPFSGEPSFSEAEHGAENTAFAGADDRKMQETRDSGTLPTTGTIAENGGMTEAAADGIASSRSVRTPAQPSVLVLDDTAGMNRSHFWKIAAKPHWKSCQVEEGVSCTFGPEVMELVYSVHFASAQELPSFFRVEVPEKMRVHQVFLADERKPLTLRSTRIRSGELGIFCMKSVSDGSANGAPEISAVSGTSDETSGSGTPNAGAADAVEINDGNAERQPTAGKASPSAAIPGENGVQGQKMDEKRSCRIEIHGSIDLGKLESKGTVCEFPRVGLSGEEFLVVSRSVELFRTPQVLVDLMDEFAAAVPSVSRHFEKKLGIAEKIRPIASFRMDPKERFAGKVILRPNQPKILADVRTVLKNRKSEESEKVLPSDRGLPQKDTLDGTENRDGKHSGAGAGPDTEPDLKGKDAGSKDGMERPSETAEMDGSVEAADSEGTAETDRTRTSDDGPKMGNEPKNAKETETGNRDVSSGNSNVAASSPSEQPGTAAEHAVNVESSANAGGSVKVDGSLNGDALAAKDSGTPASAYGAQSARDSGWQMSVELALEVENGLADEIVVEIPGGFATPFVLEPPMPFELEPIPDGEVRHAEECTASERRIPKGNGKPAGKTGNGRAGDSETGGASERLENSGRSSGRMEEEAKIDLSEDVVLSGTRGTAASRRDWVRMVIHPPKALEGAVRIRITGGVREELPASIPGEIADLPRLRFPGMEIRRHDVVLPASFSKGEKNHYVWKTEGLSPISASAFPVRRNLETSAGAPEDGSKNSETGRWEGSGETEFPQPEFQEWKSGETVKVFRVSESDFQAHLEPKSRVLMNPSVSSAVHLIYRNSEWEFLGLGIFDLLPEKASFCILRFPRCMKLLELHLDSLPVQLEEVFWDAEKKEFLQRDSGNHEDALCRFYRISLRSLQFPQRLEVLYHSASFGSDDERESRVGSADGSVWPFGAFFSKKTCGSELQLPGMIQQNEGTFQLLNGARGAVFLFAEKEAGKELLYTLPRSGTPQSGISGEKSASSSPLEKISFVELQCRCLKHLHDLANRVAALPVSGELAREEQYRWFESWNLLRLSDEALLKESLAAIDRTEETESCRKNAETLFADGVRIFESRASREDLAPDDLKKKIEFVQKNSLRLAFARILPETLSCRSAFDSKGASAFFLEVSPHVLPVRPKFIWPAAFTLLFTILVLWGLWIYPKMPEELRSAPFWLLILGTFWLLGGLPIWGGCAILAISLLWTIDRFRKRFAE